jgi:Zn-dependent protease/CBS domain-containing protein
MKLNGFRLFRIGGIEIIADYSWVVVFFLVIYTVAFYLNYTAPQYWVRGAVMGVIAAVLLFLSVLIHELAHSFVAIKHGIKILSIRLLVFGGLPQVASEPQNGRHEFLIALAGPASSMALGILFLTVYFSTAATGSPAAGIALYLGWANILLTVLNMIPGFPLDGGRILRAFLWDHWNDMSRATKVVSQLGNSVSLFLIILGVLQFLIGQNPIPGLWFLFIGMFMKQSAVGSYQAVMLRRALAGVQVQQIMTENVISVDWLISIDQLIHDYIYRRQFTDFPVCNRDEFVGMVSLEGVKTVSRDLWGFKQVRDIMTPVELAPCLKPMDDVTEALSRMITNDIERMPVVENGRLMGIVSRHGIMNLYKIKSDLGA